ncbi:MaoC family dehydratase [Actinacidiphila sp. DG2A-62]|uniref:MaoC family dehydratase n=1 Tax=Actinacidiphila sp. DG2A-62 TaxID=3108821 RepID=UPI002DC021A1|nr:MaoC family dehydratase [Actinacidiphila sp. DG2A-62]MEC3993744.1 MaoC family dehydratase [Actinacidiphila sp. DG2A-62]
MYFEDFTVGDVYRHARGKTVTEMDGVLITNLVMNTAQAHFNAHSREGSAFPHVLVFGGVTISMVIGLATQDTGEHALAELGLDKIRLRAPVTHGHTLYAYTEVLDKQDADRPDAGVVRFKHWGVNQDDVLVFEGERTTLVQRAGARR